MRPADESAQKGKTGPSSGRRKRFVQKTFPLGQASDLRFYKALALAEALEDEELIRKMALHE